MAGAGSADAGGVDGRLESELVMTNIMAPGRPPPKPVGNQAPATAASSRMAAAGLLDAVLADRQPLEQALTASRSLAALEPRDRGFARLLTLTCLRRLGQIDALL